MRRIDWAGLMRVGLGRPEAGGLGLDPGRFWGLSPLELRLMLGVEAAPPVGRARLEALMAAFPDGRKGGGDGGGDPGGGTGGA